MDIPSWANPHARLGQDSSDDLPEPLLLANSNSDVGTNNPTADGGGESVLWTKGEVQPPEYRDKFFAVAFLAQLSLVSFVGFGFGIGGCRKLLDQATATSGSEHATIDSPRDLEDIQVDEDGSHVKPSVIFFVLAFIPWLVSFFVTFFALRVLQQNAEGLIKMSLLLNIALCIVAFLLATFLGDKGIYLGLFWLVFAAFLGCYAKTIWHRIPFAASNVRVGVTACKSNLGVSIFAFVSPLLNFLLVVMESLALVGFVNMTGKLDSAGGMHGSFESSPIINVLIVLSLYWTSQVIKNISHVTVAGTVGSWWFTPIEASSFCSSAVTGSFRRAITYSLGSICYGSLIVAAVQLVRNSLQNVRRRRNLGVLSCIFECLLDILERLAEYFNRWAFVYVALYGYSYTEAGKNVMSLFKARGWTTVISDNLISRCLLLVATTTALISGAIVSVITALASLEGSVWMTFGGVIGFVVSLATSGIMMDVVQSAVDTIIVCFAEAPGDLEKNHPELSQEMRGTWAQIRRNHNASETMMI